MVTDEERAVLVRVTKRARVTTAVIVQNWHEELMRLVPTK